MNRYQRTSALMLGALDLDPAARAAYLDRECGDDAALKREVASLIEAHERADDFLETPAAAALAPELLNGLPDELVGRHVGAYKIIRLLGEGGMGVVYLAEDTKLGRTVALKAVAPRLTDDASWRERLRREARAAAALAHPGVATVYALEEIDGRLFIASEHVDGETLRDVIARGPLPAEDVTRIGCAIASALAAAHERGIVHRDLKPENIIYCRDGAVKILDFGLARLEPTFAAGSGSPSSNEPQLTAAGAVFGTPAYMSPEQLRGEPADARSDLFALGVLLAELASGKHPFEGPNPAVTMARILSSEPDLAGVSEPLAGIVRIAVAKSAGDRFTSASALAAALAGEPANLGTAPPHPSTSAPAHLLYWWYFHQAVACLVVIALFIAVWYAQIWLDATPGIASLLGTVIGGFTAGTLRLHLWFTARVHPQDVRAQHALTHRWVVAGDLLMAGAVIVTGILIAPEHRGPAAWLVATAVALALSTLVIEPATARAARIN